MSCGVNGVYDHTEEHNARHASEDPQGHHTRKGHGRAQLTNRNYDDCCEVCLDQYEAYMLEGSEPE